MRSCLLAHLPGLRIFAARRELRQLVSWPVAKTSRPMKYSLRSLMIVMLLAGPCSLIVVKARQLAERRACQPALKQIGIAVHAYFASHPSTP